MEISFKYYEESIKDSLAKYIRDKNPDERYTELILGLYEEGAEVTSPIRRTIKDNYHETNIDLPHLAEEIGDVLWYISQLATQLPNGSLQDIVLRNIDKTHTNYGKKFEIEDDLPISQYVERVIETYRENLPTSTEERARFFCLGLIKEIGKVSELFGEHGIDGNILDIHKVKEKLGDALWYLAAISQTYGLDLEQIALASIEKVHRRYKSDGTVIRADSLEPVDPR